MPLPMPVFLIPQAIPACFASRNASSRTASSVARTPTPVESRCPVAVHPPSVNRVVVAELPAIEAAHLAQLIDSRTPWRNSPGSRRSPRIAPHGNVVRVDGARLDIHVGHARTRRIAWPAARSRTFMPDRGVRARVADDPRLQRQQTCPSASSPACNRSRIGWRLGCMRIDSSRVISMCTGRPSSRAISAACPCTQRSSLPPKPPPFGNELNDDFASRVQPEQNRELTPILVHALALRANTDPVALRRGERGLRLQVAMLDPLRGVGPFGNVGTLRERGLDVAPLHDRRAEAVAGLVERGCVRFEGAVRIGDRLQNFVLHPDELGGLARRRRRRSVAATHASTSPT